MHDCLTFTIGSISAIGIAVRHNFRNVRPILKDTGHFDRRIAKRYFKADNVENVWKLDKESTQILFVCNNYINSNQTLIKSKFVKKYLTSPRTFNIFRCLEIEASPPIRV